MGSISRAVKKIARPKVLLPLAAIAIGGPMVAKAAAAKGAAAGTAAGAGAGGIAGIVGPAALLLTVIGTQMKKDSALSKFLNKSKDNKFIGSNTRKKETSKALPKAMSPGPKKKKKLSGISGKQKKEDEKRANIRAVSYTHLTLPTNREV